MSGEAVADLRHQEVHLQTCDQIRRSQQDSPWSFAAMVVGPQCTIRVRRSGDSLIGVPGGECTLLVDGRERRLRVTDATAAFSERHDGTGRSYGDGSLLEVRVGGDEGDGRGGIRHLLLLFDGGLQREADAEDWCQAALPVFVPPLPRPPPVTAARSDWDR